MTTGLVSDRTRIIELIHVFCGKVIGMYIRDRIFQKLDELDMTQKGFSEKTGIPQSTISDWRKKKINPTAEKVMIICKVLDVTPQWLLSGIEAQGDRGNPQKWFAIDACSLGSDPFNNGLCLRCQMRYLRSQQRH